MNILELFDHTDCKGRSVPLDKDVADLSTVGFLKAARSLRVTGDPWIVFVEKNYKGDFYVFKEGSYRSIPEIADSISSVRIIKGGLNPPQITVYEDVEYGGKSANITEEAGSVEVYGLKEIVSSYKVQSGCWILFEQKDLKEKKMATVAGDNISSLEPLGWKNGMKSLKPADPYQAHE